MRFFALSHSQKSCSLQSQFHGLPSRVKLLRFFIGTKTPFLRRLKWLSFKCSSSSLSSSINVDRLILESRQWLRSNWRRKVIVGKENCSRDRIGLNPSHSFRIRMFPSKVPRSTRVRRLWLRSSSIKMERFDKAVGCKWLRLQFCRYSFCNSSKPFWRNTSSWRVPSGLPPNSRTCKKEKTLLVIFKHLEWYTSYWQVVKTLKLHSFYLYFIGHPKVRYLCQSGILTICRPLSSCPRALASRFWTSARPVIIDRGFEAARGRRGHQDQEDDGRGKIHWKNKMLIRTRRKKKRKKKSKTVGDISSGSSWELSQLKVALNFRHCRYPFPSRSYDAFSY